VRCGVARGHAPVVHLHVNRTALHQAVDVIRVEGECRIEVGERRLQVTLEVQEGAARVQGLRHVCGLVLDRLVKQLQRRVVVMSADPRQGRPERLVALRRGRGAQAGIRLRRLGFWQQRRGRLETVAKQLAKVMMESEAAM